MAQQQKPKAREKINQAFFLMLAAAVAAVTYFGPISVYREHQRLTSDIEDANQSISEGEEKLAQHPMYKRINEYGRGVGALASIMDYKDASIAWFQLIPDIARITPKDVTINSIDYAEGAKAISFSIQAPSWNRLLQFAELMENSGILKNVNFTRVKQSNITQNGSKEQLVGYVFEGLTASVNPAYLKEKYDFAQEQKKASVSQESIKDVESNDQEVKSKQEGSGATTESGPASNSGSIESQTSSTGSSLIQIKKQKISKPKIQ